MSEVLFLVVICSAVIGSFLNMLIARLPNIINQNNHFLSGLKSLALPRSHCDSCQKTLTASMLIPVVSFIIQKSRCGFCNARIPSQVLIVELSTIALAVLLFFEPNITKAVWLFVFFSSCFVLLMIDIKHHILPNEITLPLLWLGLWINLSAGFVSLSEAVLGAIIGYSILWIIHQLFFLLRQKEGVGYGDFKLLSAIGAWFGWQILPLVLLVSSILAIIFFLIKKYPKDQPIAFGPFLVVAIFLIIFTPLKAFSL